MSSTDRTSSIRNTHRLVRILVFAALIVVAIIFLVPLFWIFISSFKLDSEINQAGGFLILPKTWSITNFQEILNPNNKQLPVLRWYGNSILITGVHTMLALTIYSLSAYAYAKLKFAGKNFIFLSMLFLSSFPPVINLIPTYKLMLNFGWLNSPMALIVYGLSGMFNIFLIRQFMIGVPDSLLESARIDGAGEARIFLRIMLPLVKPVLIIVALFCFTTNWNEFLWPSIAINNIDYLPLTAGLQLAKGAYGSQAARMSTVAVVAILPIIILYLFMQKYFISGISLSSGVKG